MKTSTPQRSLNRYKRRFGIAILLFIATSSLIYISDRVKFVNLDNKFDPKYGYSVGRREQYFARKFPSTSEIQTYLSDATILFSHPPSGNIIFYFKSTGHEFVSWHDQAIEKGEWRIWPQLYFLVLGGQWRIAIVYAFCSSFSGLSLAAQQDNCRELESFDSIFAQGRGTRTEYRKGDVFSLSELHGEVRQLPRSEISFDALLLDRSR